MRLRTWMGLGLAIAAGCAAGCGSEPLPESSTARVLVPWRLGLACNAGALDAMEATLYVDTSAVCPLDVSPVDYSVSGSCPGVVENLVRPLVLEYRLPGTPEPIPLAYLFSSVDLRAPSTTRIAVDVTGETIVYTQAALDAIVPTGTCPTPDTSNPDVWGGCFVTETLGRTLDCGQSGEANLVRACEERLSCP